MSTVRSSSQCQRYYTLVVSYIYEKNSKHHVNGNISQLDLSQINRKYASLSPILIDPIYSVRSRSASERLAALWVNRILPRSRRQSRLLRPSVELHLVESHRRMVSPTHTNKQTHKQTNKQTNTQTHKQTNTQTNKQIISNKQSTLSLQTLHEVCYLLINYAC